MSRASKLNNQLQSAVAETIIDEVEIDTEVIDGVTYYIAVVGQTEYTIYQNKKAYGTDWVVMSKRQNMRTDGQTKFYKTLKDLEAKVKGLKGISALID